MKTKKTDLKKTAIFTPAGDRPVRITGFASIPEAKEALAFFQSSGYPAKYQPLTGSVDVYATPEVVSGLLDELLGVAPEPKTETLDESVRRISRASSRDVRLVRLSQNRAHDLTDVVSALIDVGPSRFSLTAAAEEVRVSFKHTDGTPGSEKVSIVFTADGIDVDGETLTPAELREAVSAYRGG